MIEKFRIAGVSRRACAWCACVPGNIRMYRRYDTATIGFCVIRYRRFEPLTIYLIMSSVSICETNRERFQGRWIELFLINSPWHDPLLLATFMCLTRLRQALFETMYHFFFP